MKCLTDKIAEMRDEQICAVLSELFRRIDADKPVAFDPDDILLDENFAVRIRASHGPENWIWKAPEVVRAAFFGLEIPPEPSQAWFSMGMLAYWMYHRTDYYARNGLRVLDVALNGLPRPCVISEQDALEIPFPGAVSALTAWEAQHRGRGVAEFRAYCATRSYASATGRRLSDLAKSAGRTTAEKGEAERWLYLSKACLTGQRKDYNSEIKILKLDGQDAETTLRLKTGYLSPFRAYRVAPDEPLRCLGSFQIPGPIPSGNAYSVSLRYRAAERCLYVEASAYGKSARKIRVSLGEVL